MAENIISEASREEPGYESVIHGTCEALFFSLFRVYSAEEEEAGSGPLLYTGLSPVFGGRLESLQSGQAE